ncbi:MAG: DoxX family protein, partial [Actinomycetota bacterium]
AELVCAGLLLDRRTRRAGALATIAVLVGVFPANVKMAIDWQDRSLPERLVAYGRLPLQVPLVLWALGVRRGAARPPGEART